MVVKFLWPYNIFYSDGISLGLFLFWSSLLCLFLPFFYSLNYFAHGGVSGDLIYWCRILGLFPSPRTESLMLVILTIFYFCSLYLRFNKNLPAIHCHFFPTGSCLFLRGCCEFSEKTGGGGDSSPCHRGGKLRSGSNMATQGFCQLPGLTYRAKWARDGGYQLDKSTPGFWKEVRVRHRHGGNNVQV